MSAFRDICALEVDIGFGNAVTPAPEAESYPVLLDDLPAPQLRSPPKYTVVAKKFHAICLLGVANTRMNDYFDLWVLLTPRVPWNRPNCAVPPRQRSGPRS